MRKHKTEKGVYCLNRGWKFLCQDISVLPESRTHDAVYEYAKSGGARGPAMSGFDDSAWQPVTLPHDWVTQQEFRENAVTNHGSKERGIGWYRICFCLEEQDREKQIYLKFEGLSAEAKIYLNGLLVKRSFSGYNGFVIDISDTVNYGMVPNILAVRIDACVWEGWWYEGAGIYRNVWLLKKAQVHIAEQGVFIKPEKVDGGFRLLLETEAENSSLTDCSCVLIHRIYAPDGREVALLEKEITVSAGGTVCDRQETVLSDPVLWDIEAPELYCVRTAILGEAEELDFQYHSFGLRTICFDADTGFWLNGKNVKLKGFCNHQDHAGIGVAVPKNIKEYRMRKLLSSGANAYRCAHNPDPDILEICDRLGMLVMEENRVFSTEEDNLLGLEGIVKRARNHPCVILYSIGNEEPWFGTEKGRKIAETMCRHVKSIDPSRPVTAAFSGGFLEPEGAVKAVDVVGINYNDLWYDEFRKLFPHKPVYASETVSSYSVREVYQSDRELHLLDCYDREKAMWGSTVRDMWRDVVSRPYMAGTFAWTGLDYRGEPSPFQWPSVASFFGAWDSCGYEKGAAWLYRALWSEEPMVHIISPWHHRSQVGNQIEVMVVSNGDFVKLSANGCILAQGEIKPYTQFSCTITCEEGELKAESFRNGILEATDTQRTSGEAAKLVVVPEWEELKDPLMDAALFHVRVCDSRGNVVPEAEPLLRFGVENGVILGVGNGDPGSHEPDVAPYRHAFHGLAQVIVRPDGKAPVRIIARANGLDSAVGETKVAEAAQMPEIVPVTESLVEGWKFCRRIFDEKPSGSIEVEESDMNSYQPISFQGLPPRELMNRKGKYGLYFTRYYFHGTREGDSLYFEHVNGSVWVYLDGGMLKAFEESCFGPIQIMLPGGIVGEHILSIIVQNSDDEHPFAGICSPVFYRNGGAHSGVCKANGCERQF